MHRICVLLILSSLLCLASAHPEENKRFWILFKDRNSASARPAGESAPRDFSAASRLRRSLRAETLWEQSDLPVAAEYKKMITQAGGVIYRESRWLNGVSAYCNDACRSRISTLPFVSEILPVLTYHRPSDRFSHSPQLNSGIFRHGQPSGYGQSAPQLNQINVPRLHKQGFAGQREIVAIFDSGFRKDHIAFQKHKILAEKDFVFNDDDVSDGTETDMHGTATWSLVGGEAPGLFYGPAYRARVLLAVTEDIRTETEVEEDNWVAALEWADRQGATVVSSSLGYSDFYLTNQLNGRKAITSRAASTAARKGIVLVNSAGNDGPRRRTISPPADARKILAVGAVDSEGRIAFFSSRGPTYDGRIKPEIVARGVETFAATSVSSSSFDYVDGTSFSCPLVAGAAAVLLSAHPDWKPNQVRAAFLNTANKARKPNNTFGWGIIDLAEAADYLPKGVIVIEHIPPTSNLNSSKNFSVEARIRAERGLAFNKLFLFWSTKHAQFQQIELSRLAGKADFFFGIIPAQPSRTEILYYLTAADKTGKLQQAPLDAPQVTFHAKFR